MKYTLQLSCLIFMTFIPTIKAQQTNILTLRDAFAEAERTYPGLAERTAAVAEFEFRKKEVQSRSIPQVQLQAQQAYGTFQGISGAFFPLPGVFNVTGNSSGLDTEIRATGNTFGSVLMDWKIFEFGKQRKTVAAAAYQAQGARSSYDASRIALQAKVSRLYLDVFYNKAHLQWAEKNISRVRQILELTVSLAAAGLKPGADTAIVSSAYAQALAVRHEWLGKYEASKASFMEVVPAVNWSVPDLLPVGTAVLDLNPDSVNPTHPYLQVIEKQLAYEEVREQVAARKALPSLSILAGLAIRGSGIAQNGMVNSGIGSGYQNFADNYLIGAGLTWNIGTAYTSSLERKRARKVTEGVQAKYQLQQIQMNTALQAWSSRIVQQQALLIQTKKAFAKASDAYELYLARYQGGLINLTELLQLQALLQAADREHLQAGQHYWNMLVAQAELSTDFSLLLNHFN